MKNNNPPIIIIKINNNISQDDDGLIFNMAALTVYTANSTDDNSSVGVVDPTAFNTFFNSLQATSRASCEF